MKDTPQQRWAESRRKYRTICSKILGVSPDIRYVGAINEYGRTLAGILRPNIKPFLKPDQTRDELVVIASLINLRQRISSAAGRLDSVVFRHAKIIIIVLQKSKIVYYITIDSKKQDIPDMVSKIKKLI